jgi:hypothetical protein
MNNHPFNITNPNFKYVPADKTNVMDTLIKHGFVPPTTIRGYFEKRRKALMEQMSYEEYKVEL